MFFLVSLSVCFLASQHAVQAASCHLREIDLCLATVLLGASGGVPLSDEELDKFCEPLQEGFECLGNYSATCFTPQMKELLDMLMAVPMKHGKLMCTHGTDERAKFLKQAPCLLKIMSADKMKPLLQDLMTALEVITKAEFQKRIPIICCGFQRMFADFISMVEAECGKEIIDEGDKTIGMSVSSLSGIFCRGYDKNSPKCNGILPPPGTPSEGSDLQLIQFMKTAMDNL